MPDLSSTDGDLGDILLRRGRQAIASHLGLGEPPPAATDGLLAQRASTFVTLKSRGELRGCMGSIRAQKALGEDVVANAIAAATRDPRFPPLTADELERVVIEVSLLSEPHYLEFGDEAALLGQVRPGVDGLIIFSGCRSATFLPQVWEQLPEPRRFLAALKHKAGLDADRPAPRLMAATFTVRKWTEASATPAPSEPQ